MGKVKIFFISFMISFQFGIAQWQQTAGPNGGSMKEIVQVGTTLVVSAGNGGIYKSENNGSSWELSINGLPANPSVWSLVEDNGTLYCSVWGNAVYKSVDSAENWEPVNSGVETLTFYSLLADGVDLYAGNANGGIYYSNNGGVTWSFSSGVTSTIQFQGFEIFNSNVYAGGTSLYESSDAGVTWDEIEIPGLFSNGVRSMVAADGVFYIGDDKSIFMSTDMVNWTKAILNTEGTVTSLTAQEGRVYATISRGRYFSTDDGGVNWTLIENPQTDKFAQYVYSSNGKVIMSTSEGLYTSTDMGISWSEANSGIRAINVNALYGYDDILFAGALSSQGIFKSRDNGSSWTSINNGLDALNALSIYKIIKVGDTLYIATGGGIYESTDEGDNWIRKLDPGLNKSTQVLGYDNGVFVSGPSEMSNGIYLSIDGTDTWKTILIDGLNEGTSFESIVIEGNTIVISTVNGELFLTQNLGDSWANISIPGGFYFTYDIELVDGTLYAGTARGLFVSYDFGGNWSFLNDEPRTIRDLEIVEGTIYATTNNGFYATEKDRNKWFDFNEGIGNLGLNSLFLKGNEIFVGALAASVWKLQRQEVLLPSEDNDGDGVLDYQDSCPNTQVGVEVNEIGCEVVPANAILVYGETPTCAGLSNGKIEVATTLTNRVFNVQISSETYSKEFLDITLSDVLEIENLAAGDYLVSVSIPDIQFERSFGVVVNKVNAITGKRQSTNFDSRTVTYKVTGSTEYIVNVNGEEKGFFFDSALENEILLKNLKAHNLVSIRGKSDCQGVISDSFATTKEFLLYPIMTKGQVTIDGDYNMAEVRVFDFSGRLVLEKIMFRNEATSIDLKSFESGIYPIQIISNGKTQTFKIVKQ